VDLESSLINLNWHNEAYALLEDQPLDGLNPQFHSIIRVHYSLLSSIRMPAGHLFLTIGTNAATGNNMLSMSMKNASVVSVPNSWSVHVDGARGLNAQYLSIVAGYLLCQQIFAIVPPGSTMLIYEPDAGFASLLSKQAAARASKAIFITSNPEIAKRNWIYLHPRSSKRTIDTALPKDISIYLDFAMKESTVTSLGFRIADSLPRACEIRDASLLIHKESRSLSDPHGNEMTAILKQASNFARGVLNGVPDGMPLHVIRLSDICKDGTPVEPLSIVNWRDQLEVPITVESIETREDFFKDDKTYWLAGLAGDLGQSLCDWMILHGARYIVLTSRNPKAPVSWVENHKKNGATVCFFAS
jgi:hypothetical protein